MLGRLIDSLMGRKRVLIDENERALWLYKGELRGIVGPGEHALPNRRGMLRLKRHSLVQPELRSAYEATLFDKLPGVAVQHLTRVRTGESEVAP